MCKLAGEQKRTKPLCVLFRLGSGCFPRACSWGPCCVQDTACTYCPSTALPLSFSLLCWGTLMFASRGDFAGCRSPVLHSPGCRSFMLHPPAAWPFPSWHISDEQRTQLWGFFTDISCDQGCSTLLVRQTWQPKQTPALIPCSLCCAPWVSHPFTCTRKLLGSSPT